MPVQIGNRTYDDASAIDQWAQGPQPPQGGVTDPLAFASRGIPNPATYSYGPGYTPSGDASTLGPAMAPQTQTLGGAGGDAAGFSGGPFSSGAPDPSKLQFEAGGYAPTNWQNFLGDSTVNGGYFTGQQLATARERQNPPEWAGLSGGGGFESQGAAPVRPSSGPIAPVNNFGNAPAAQYQAGAGQPSTNNWRLLPPGYNKPGFVMRNGQIIDLSLAQQQLSSGMANGKPMHTRSYGEQPSVIVGGNWNSFPSFVGWPGQLGAWSMYGTPTD